MTTISNTIWDLNKELWEHRNDVLHKNDNAVRTLENERLDTDIANIIEEIKLIPRQFLPATDKRFFQKRTLIKIRKKKFPQKRKWYRQATVILRDYTKEAPLDAHGQFKAIYLANVNECQKDEHCRQH